MACEKSAVLIILCTFFNLYSRGVEGIWNISEEEELEFEKQLKILNKPPVKTFQSASGIVYDCINLYKQPAFDNPLLKNHKLQLRPSSYPKGDDETRAHGENSKFQRNNTCPSGTVLIRRTQKNDLIYLKHLQKHVKRHVSNIQPQDGPDVDQRHYATMKSDFGEYYGSRASLIVYGFPRFTLQQATISQIWVIGGAEGDETKINTVQAGWQVNPSANDGSSGTFLATYWTSAGYSNGCFNLLCQGFLVLSPDFGPGSEITELSTYGGIQKSIDIVIFKDPKTGNWWLAYGKDMHEVGYWPKELFNNLDKATEVDWGGAVVHSSKQPSPPMGSGHFPSEGKNKSAYFTNIQLVNEKNEFYNPEDYRVTQDTDRPDYYGIEGNYYSGDPDGYQFRYGGPGEI